MRYLLTKCTDSDRYNAIEYEENGLYLSPKHELAGFEIHGPAHMHTVKPVDYQYTDTDFYRAMLCIRGTSHGPVSVRLSVTSRCSTKTAKRRITQKHHTIAQGL